MISITQAERTAQVRRLAQGALLIHFPDIGETFVGLNLANLLDISRARRLSRGAAHRVVDAMDAIAEQKAYYHKLIDEEAAL